MLAVPMCTITLRSRYLVAFACLRLLLLLLRASTRACFSSFALFSAFAASSSSSVSSSGTMKSARSNVSPNAKRSLSLTGSRRTGQKSMRLMLSMSTGGSFLNCMRRETVCFPWTSVSYPSMTSGAVTSSREAVTSAHSLMPCKSVNMEVSSRRFFQPTIGAESVYCTFAPYSRVISSWTVVFFMASSTRSKSMWQKSLMSCCCSASPLSHPKLASSSVVLWGSELFCRSQNSLCRASGTEGSSPGPGGEVGMW
mmetsp:Transcript_22904/g.54412  ORF Transcript_22904/g.54412 Transcript_22904/m.54412 type:complete len:254 (-) Transcript_22904:989-1750(-)